MGPAAALLLPALLFAAQLDGKPRLEGVRVNLDGRRVEIGFQLVNAFTDELVERIETGLPSGFDFQFKLQKDNKRWFDNDLRKSTLQVVAMYNAVNHEYLVNFKQDGKLVESSVVRDRDELRRSMTRFERLPVFDLEGIQGRRRLIVEARAKLGSRHILGFIPSTIATDWVQSAKFRSPPDFE